MTKRRVPYTADRPERFEISRADVANMSQAQAYMMADFASDISTALWQGILTRTEAADALRLLAKLLEGGRRRAEEG